MMGTYRKKFSLVKAERFFWERCSALSMRLPKSLPDGVYCSIDGPVVKARNGHEDPLIDGWWLITEEDELGTHQYTLCPKDFWATFESAKGETNA